MNQTEVNITTDGSFDTIRSAVNKAADLVKPTFGPASNKVIIDKPMYRMVVDDGVQILRDLEFNDPDENAALKVMRETAIKTNDRVGDGTTGAVIMLQAILEQVAKKRRFDGRKIELELKRGLEDVRKQLTKSAKQIKTREDIKKIALVSFDDEKIADMVADLYHKLGEDAVITLDRSQTMDTTAETSDGVKISTGYLSPYMVTNGQRMETDVDNPHILITDYRLTEANDVLPIMNKLAAEGKGNLVIIAENVEQHALATLVINLPHVMNPQTQQPGKLMSIAIAAPKDIDDRKVFLEDIALMTGAKMFTESKGSKVETAEVKDLGRARKFICRREESIIVGPLGDKSSVATAVSSLRSAMESEKDPKKKEKLQRRLGVFTNRLAVIKVGAPTDNEQKALKYKVEDTVHCVRSALKSGVVCGSGLALSRIHTSSPILNEALRYPARQLRENMGLDEEDNIKDGHALNVVTGKTGPFMEVGVADPADVLLAGVESAVSIASILLTTSGMLVEYQVSLKVNEPNRG